MPAREHSARPSGRCYASPTVPARGDGARHTLAGRGPGSTCSSMASSSGTTWCNISASSSPASPSPSMAGCIARLALRPPADPVRRRVAARADDGRLVALCPEPDGQADEGHADGAGHHPQLDASCATICRARSSCRQIALAIRDEVLDLEAAGCKAIQVDEAALREGAPAAPTRLAALSRLGGGLFSACPRPASAVRPRSTRICAIRSSTTSCPRSAPWIPT